MIITGFIWLFSCIGAAIVASNKGRDGMGWFLIGAILGPIGFILSLVVAGNEENLQNSAIESGQFKTCEYCAELVKAQAKICKHCGKDFPSKPDQAIASNHLHKQDPKVYSAPKETKSEWDGKWF